MFKLIDLLLGGRLTLLGEVVVSIYLYCITFMLVILGMTLVEGCDRQLTLDIVFTFQHASFAAPLTALVLILLFHLDVYARKWWFSIKKFPKNLHN